MNLKRQSGFTLIETIIALSIFVLVVLAITNIYLIFNTTQRKAVTMQRIQSDVRYLFEAVSQEIRLGRINYQFYNDNSIDLHPAAASENFILGVTDQAGRQKFFRRSSNASNANDGQGTKVQYCEIDTVSGNDCSLYDDTLWQDITPVGVEVNVLKFIITPSADPYTEVAELSCVDDSDCVGSYISYRCDNVTDDRCEYYSNGNNFQPLVRLVLKVTGVGNKAAEESDILMQTTVGSRLITGEVQNDYYN